MTAMVDFCMAAASEYGAGGIACFEAALHGYVEAIKMGAGGAAGDLMIVTYRSCVAQGW
jgi:hypothetical protein